VQGRPDCIFLEPATERVYVLSHAAPNATVIDAKDGAVVGTIDLGGQPEGGVSDEKGHAYIDLEDKNSIAVVDVNTLKVTGNYTLEGKGGAPAGLAIDLKNHVLFAGCAEPATAVMLNADDGKILASLPIGKGVDGTVFNPATMEAFCSQGDGTLTVIKENSPTSFEVEQTVKTKAGAKTLALDSKTDQILLITADRRPAPARPAGQARQAGQAGQTGQAEARRPEAGGQARAEGQAGGQGERGGQARPQGQAGGQRGPGGPGGRGRGGVMVPNSFTILVVGK
jgi:hypothetical protein